jgi:hypothetical protein|tara:strand:+ start:526 stop:735 length:210 start_codon:yes stop_codon:yes gene_type:complete
MGGKMPTMPPPPAVDPSVAAKEAASEAKLAAEKKKAISIRMKGRGGTIMTGGTGLEDEAKTTATSLMSY